MSSPLNTAYRAGFSEGYTPITREGEDDLDTGIDFGIHWTTEGPFLEETSPKETVWVLLGGEAELEWPGQKAHVQRRSLFDEAPIALHIPSLTPVRVRTLSPTAEWAVARAANERHFAAKLFRPDELEPEYRGRGLVQEASLRNVRLIFDGTSRPEANLVIGEVVNYPGRWSSYPPHHHVQPEIYHYRFTLPQGYGHAELGEQVFMVRSYDTIKILDGVSHSQVAAPGYGMYYLWIVRHLPGNRYTGFTFSEEHRWVLDPSNQGWLPPRS